MTWSLPKDPNLVASGFSLWERNSDGTFSPAGYAPTLVGAIQSAQRSLRLDGRHVRIHARGGRGEARPDQATVGGE